MWIDLNGFESERCATVEIFYSDCACKQSVLLNHIEGVVPFNKKTSACLPLEHNMLRNDALSSHVLIGIQGNHLRHKGFPQPVVVANAHMTLPNLRNYLDITQRPAAGRGSIYDVAKRTRGEPADDRGQCKRQRRQQIGHGAAKDATRTLPRLQHATQEREKRRA